MEIVECKDENRVCGAGEDGVRARVEISRDIRIDDVAVVVNDVDYMTVTVSTTGQLGQSIDVQLVRPPATGSSTTP